MNKSILVILLMLNVLQFSGQPLRDPITSSVLTTVNSINSGFGPRQTLNFTLNVGPSRYHPGIDYPTNTGAGHPAFAIQSGNISTINSTGNSTAYIIVSGWRYMHMIDEWNEDFGSTATDVVWEVISDGNSLTDDDYIIIRTSQTTYILTANEDNFREGYTDELMFREAEIITLVNESETPDYPVWRAHLYGGHAHLHFDHGYGSYINPLDYVIYPDNNSNYSIELNIKKNNADILAEEFISNTIYGNSIILEPEVFNQDDKDTEDIELSISSNGVNWEEIFEWHLTGGDHLDAGNRMNGNSSFDYFDVHREYPEDNIFDATSEGFYPFRSEGGHMVLKKHWNSCHSDANSNILFNDAYPDGNYTVKALVRDVLGEERDETIDVIIDNYRPLVYRVEIRKGSSSGNLRYLGEWTGNSNNLEFSSQTPSEIEVNENLWVKVSFSEPMENVEMIAFGDTYRSSNINTEWVLNLVAGDNVSQNNIMFTTNCTDLAGNPLEGFISRDDSERRGRNSDGTWESSISENNDIVHRFDYEEVLKADFTFSPIAGDFPLFVNFEDISFGEVDSWSWNFGEGESSIEQNPSHTFNRPGKYVVDLTIKFGVNTDICSKIIELYEGVKADFTVSATSGKAPLSVGFTNKSSTNATKFKWNFGDGSTSNEENPKHTYYREGTFDVSLLVENSVDSDTETKKSFISTDSKKVVVSGIVENQNYDPVDGAVVCISIGDYADENNPDVKFTTAKDGKFEFRVENGTRAAIWVERGNAYEGTDFRWINTESGIVDNISFVIYEIKLSFFIERYSGLTYKLVPLGGTFEIDHFRFVIKNKSNGHLDWLETFDDDPTYYTFECYPDEDVVYEIFLIGGASWDDQRYRSSTVNFDVPICVSTYFDANELNCQLIPLGKTLGIENLSYPIEQIGRYNVDWGEGGKKEIWDTENCIMGDCESKNHFLFNEICPDFYHEYSNPGKYSIKFITENLAGQAGEEWEKQVFVTDCSLTYNSDNYHDSYCCSTSSKDFIDFKIDNEKAEDVFIGGSYVFDEKMSDAGSKMFNACEEMVLKPGFELKPSTGESINFKINDCLKDYEDYIDKEKSSEEIYFSPDKNIEDQNEYLEPNNNIANSTLIKESFNKTISIFPNPSKGRITCKIADIYELPGFIEVYSQLGNLILREKMNEYSKEINLDHVPQGLYIIKISIKDEIYSCKISKL